MESARCRKQAPLVASESVLRKGIEEACSLHSPMVSSDCFEWSCCCWCFEIFAPNNGERNVLQMDQEGNPEPIHAQRADLQGQTRLGRYTLNDQYFILEIRA